MELNDPGPGPRWLAWALASLVTTAALGLVYFASSAVAPLLFEPEVFRVKTGGRVVEVREGASQEEVERLFGKKFEERPTPLKDYRERIYRFEKDRPAHRFLFKDDRLESVGRGEHGPRARRFGRRGFF